MYIHIQGLIQDFLTGGGNMDARLMRIAIEGPELGDADFDKILEVFGEQNRRLSFEPQLTFN